MSNEKRRVPTAPTADPKEAPPQEGEEPDLFDDIEHDGWGPIVRRTPTPSPAPQRGDSELAGARLRARGRAERPSQPVGASHPPVSS